MSCGLDEIVPEIGRTIGMTNDIALGHPFDLYYGTGRSDHIRHALFVLLKVQKSGDEHHEGQEDAGRDQPDILDAGPEHRCPLKHHYAGQRVQGKKDGGGR